MALDPQAAAMLETIAKMGGMAIHTMEPREAREVFSAMRSTSGAKEPVGDVADRVIPGPHDEIPIRIYKPMSADGSALPVLVYFHGGGFVLGDLESHDPVCRTLSNGAECIVVSVDYRLAPEHKFPAAVDDAFTALEWVAKNASEIGGVRDQIAVGGDSAGGNLAAVVSSLATERQSPDIALQLLIYPSTGVGVTRSFEENGEELYLTKNLMAWYRSHYMRSPDDAKNPRLSPYLQDDTSGLPRALIMTAEYDPLRDDGKAYAAKLEASGIDAEYLEYPGMIHGFVAMAGSLDVGKRALHDASAALKSAFRKSDELTAKDL